MSVPAFHPGTAPFVQQPSLALFEAGLLDRFYTAIRDRPAGRRQRLACALASLGVYDLRRQLGRRAVTEIPADHVSTFPFREWVRLLSVALDRGGRLTDLIWGWAEPGFDRKVSRQLHVGLRDVYSFKSSSLLTFTAALLAGEDLPPTRRACALWRLRLAFAGYLDASAHARALDPVVRTPSFGPRFEIIAAVLG